MKFYVGSSSDVEQRLKLHNLGRVKATSNGVPWNVVYVEVFESSLEARRREHEIKGWNSAKRIQRMINM